MGFIIARASTRNCSRRMPDGLIGLSGRLASEINSALQAGNVEKAQNLTAQYRDIFGPRNFFIELHHHGMAEQKQCNAHLPKFAREFGTVWSRRMTSTSSGAAITERMTFCFASTPPRKLKTNSGCVMSLNSISNRPRKCAKFSRFSGRNY